MPTAAGATLKVTGSLAPAEFVTNSVASPAAVSNGSWALIWCGETKLRGMLTPFTFTETSASWPAQGAVAAVAVETVRFEPKIENSEPGATGETKLAPFTIPPALTTGLEGKETFRMR